jgi:hypothetical protein
MPVNRYVRIVPMSVLLFGAASAHAASTVTTSGTFHNYTGPVGYPIYAGPERDAATSYDSHFTTASGTVIVAPQSPHAGYEAPAFNGAGKASHTFAPSTSVEFWNRIESAFDENHSLLQITGTITPDVAIDPNTQHSGLILLGTVSYQNGSWFGSQPFYNPGNGPLYGPSEFAFSLTATPVPFIGSGSGPSHIWNDTLVLTSTFGAGTPDRLSFKNRPELGYADVNEGITGTFEIWGRIGSLEPVELRNGSAGVTLGATPIPEPATLLPFVAVGLLGLFRRRSARSIGLPVT